MDPLARRVSMPRPRSVDGAGFKGVAAAGSFLVQSKIGRGLPDAGEFSEATVYTGVRMLEKFVGVPKSLTDQAALGAIARSTSLWEIGRSGRENA
jgi:hypothetical protein